MSLMEQMANVGSEVERAIRAHEQNNPDRWNRALERALELFDLTAADHRWRGPRCREILRAREYFCALFFADEPEVGAEEYLREYFLEFAVAARAG